MKTVLMSYAHDKIKEASSILEEMALSDQMLSDLEVAICICTSALKSGHKILLAGNGGSAADAQHIAGELVSRFAFDRPGLAAIALTTDTSILTAIGNDYGYEFLFSRQIEALASAGDVFIAYSTSGKSRNILKALEGAGKKGIRTIGLSGQASNEMASYCDVMLSVPSMETPKIQEAHLVIGHILCGAIENELFGNKWKQ